MTGASEVAVVGAFTSILGAGWAVISFARQSAASGPLIVLSVGALLLVGGNLYDEEPLSALDVAAFMALALGFAASSYTVLRRKGTRSSGGQ